MSNFSVVIFTAVAPGHQGDPADALIQVDGRESLLRAVDLFTNREPIKQIQIVLPAANYDQVKRDFGTHFMLAGAKLVQSGPKYGEQLAAALPKVDPAATHVFIHDAARPAVPWVDVEQLIREAGNRPVIALASPLRSALIETDQFNAPVALHSAGTYQRLLHPMLLTRQRYAELVEKKRDLHPSEFHLLKGSSYNIRVGGHVDAVYAKAMIGLLPKPKAKAPSNPFEEAQW